MELSCRVGLGRLRGSDRAGLSVAIASFAMVTGNAPGSGPSLLLLTPISLGG